MKVLVIIVLVLLTRPSLAQESERQPAEAGRHAHVRHLGAPAMTLAALEESALQNNPEIQAVARRVTSAETRISGAGALDDAQVMYRGWGVPFREPWNYNQAQNMFMLSQAFPGRGKRLLRSQAAGQEAEVAKAGLEAVKRDVLVQVRHAYFELLRTYDELRLHNEEVALARQAVESARIKYTVGRVPQQDVLKAQAGLTRLVEHLIEFETNADLARAKLNTLIGRDPDQPLEVSGEYSFPGKLPSLQELKQTAIETRPELAALRARIQQRTIQAELARKAYTPDVTVSAGYMLMPAGSPFRNNYMAEVTVNLPWLNKRKHDADITAALSETAAETAELDRVQRTAFHEIQQALIRARGAHRAVELYRDTLRSQARAALKAASAAYETDRTDFLNLLDSQTTALGVEYAYYRALAEFDTRIAELERASGALIVRRAAQEVRR